MKSIQSQREEIKLSFFTDLIVNAEYLKESTKKLLDQLSDYVTVDR